MTRRNLLRLFRAVNKNACAGFETNDRNVVVSAAPIIRRYILGLPLDDAINVLTRRGWDIEDYMSDTKSWTVEP